VAAPSPAWRKRLEVHRTRLRGHGDRAWAPDTSTHRAYSIAVTRCATTFLGHEHSAVAGAGLSVGSCSTTRPRLARLRNQQVNSSTPVPPPLNEVVRRPADFPEDDVPNGRAPPIPTTRAPANDPEGCCRVDKPPRRTARTYVAGMYGHRLWGTPERVSPREEVAVHTRAPTTRRSYARALVRVTTTRPGPDDGRTFRAFVRKNADNAARVCTDPDDHVVLPSFPWKAAAPMLTARTVCRAERRSLPPWKRARTFNKITNVVCRLVSGVTRTWGQYRVETFPK